MSRGDEEGRWDWEYLKKESAILEWWDKRRRVWWTRGGVRETVPRSWREDSMWWKGLWCWIRIWDRVSASGEGRSCGSVGFVVERDGVGWGEESREESGSEKEW